MLCLSFLLKLLLYPLQAFQCTAGYRNMGLGNTIIPRVNSDYNGTVIPPQGLAHIPDGRDGGPRPHLYYNYGVMTVFEKKAVVFLLFLGTVGNP